MFWRCSKQVGCGFFKWDDELDVNQVSEPWNGSGSGSGNRPLQSKTSSSRSDSVCYKCNQKGHFANACTSGRQEGTRQVKGSKQTSRVTSKRTTTSKVITAAKLSKKKRPL
ncbi:hypothetical protein BCR41DRAFT_359445 [Lobosporangium transversale]|uniref:CCHC-type domain-containing protein n=1 Tax=Lobosporangium transversale TaxID=64571 RepID=A0A1Y2GEM0_9FUNG|nr:hypothetical protein BCR41DRAFT_359445 [Lobosporangium transversale]ORZ08578.1 hypothetical protein BCR41DRAFT_359445 [Lobosporangium transversale]|eukprot:XP_021878506.1 hypothetical protein BCR41DRAFT_359445 [Lobosporangium transversale]